MEDDLILDPANTDPNGSGEPNGSEPSPGELFAQGGEPQPQQQQQQQQPTWNGSEYQLNYRGQMVAPQSKEELINLAQKGYSYSQAMEQLKKERSAWEEEMKSKKALFDKYDQFDGMLKKNPQLTQHLMQQIQDFHSQAKQQGAGPQQQQSYVPPELVDRIGALEQMIAMREQAEADSKLDADLAALRHKHPNYAWDGENGLEQQLLQFADYNNIISLDHAFRIMMWDSMQTEQRANGMKQVQQQRRQGIVQSGQPAPVSPKAPTYKRGDSYNDLAERMAAELKM